MNPSIAQMAPGQYGTQKKQVMAHLREHGKITSWEAIEKYGITRLSEYIRSLRREDEIEILDIWREMNGRRFKEYYMRFQ